MKYLRMKMMRSQICNLNKTALVYQKNPFKSIKKIHAKIAYLYFCPYFEQSNRLLDNLISWLKIIKS